MQNLINLLTKHSDFIFSTVLSITAIIGIVLSYYSIRLTRQLEYEKYRPNLVVYYSFRDYAKFLDYINKHHTDITKDQHDVFFIRNFGATSAYVDKIIMEANNYIDKEYTLEHINMILSEFEKQLIAPNQEISIMIPHTPGTKYICYIKYHDSKEKTYSNSFNFTCQK